MVNIAFVQLQIIHLLNLQRDVPLMRGPSATAGPLVTHLRMSYRQKIVSGVIPFVFPQPLYVAEN